MTVDLVTNREYDFAEDLESVQAQVADWGVLTGLDVYVNVEP